MLRREVFIKREEELASSKLMKLSSLLLFFNRFEMEKKRRREKWILFVNDISTPPSSILRIITRYLGIV